MLKRSVLSRLVTALATFKLAAGLAAFFATYAAAAGKDPNFPYIFYGLFAAVFGSTGALLLLGGRQDRRALALGGFFLVTATSWSGHPLAAYSAANPDLFTAALAVALQPAAFMAWFLWRFVRDFPQPPVSPRERRRLLIAARLSATAGVLLFALNLMYFAAQRLSFGRAWQWLAWFTPQRGRGTYYSVVMGLAAVAFALLLWRARGLSPERHRARTFLQIIAVTLGPAALEVLMELFVPGYRVRLAASPRLHRATVIICLLPMLTLPVTTAYAVFVHRVMDVRLIARRALQYLLARYSVLAVVTVPLISLAAYFYNQRSSRLDELISGPRVLILLSVARPATATFPEGSGRIASTRSSRPSISPTGSSRSAGAKAVSTPPSGASRSILPALKRELLKVRPFESIAVTASASVHAARSGLNERSGRPSGR